MLGYDLRFRSDDGADGAARGSSSAYLIDSSTMVFDWESLPANARAFMQQLVGNPLAFINVDAPALLRDAPGLRQTSTTSWFG